MTENFRRFLGGTEKISMSLSKKFWDEKTERMRTRGERNFRVNFLCRRNLCAWFRKKLAARLGVEPRQNESESFVLPLHNRAVKTENAPGGNRRGRQDGAGDGSRTRNRLFTKQVLYH